MYKQLIKAYDSRPQEIKTFSHKSGTHGDKTQVLWDERKDGKLEIDSEKLGGYERVEGELVFSQAMLDVHAALVASLESAKSDEVAKKAARKDLLKDKNASTKDRLDALIEHLGLDL